MIFDSHAKKSKIIAIEEFDQRLKNYDNHELLHKEEKEYIALWKKYFDSIGIEGTARPETLDVKDFVALSNLVNSKLQSPQL